ncbi:MAG: hypothetical protein M1821_001504 [Bathelium mastoideum]|nr:MAG: hypothetical protein M1821_001504 [Bathelium mastoideum]
MREGRSTEEGVCEREESFANLGVEEQEVGEWAMMLARRCAERGGGLQAGDGARSELDTGERVWRAQVELLRTVVAFTPETQWSWGAEGGGGRGLEADGPKMVHVQTLMLALTNAKRRNPKDSESHQHQPARERTGEGRRRADGGGRDRVRRGSGGSVEAERKGRG